jgi:hypothetical protein
MNVGVENQRALMNLQRTRGNARAGIRSTQKETIGQQRRSQSGIA